MIHLAVSKIVVRLVFFGEWLVKERINHKKPEMEKQNL